MDVQGSILDHEYRIGEGRDKIAEVSKKWFLLRDTYGVQVEDGQSDTLLLTVTVALGMMSRQGHLLSLTSYFNLLFPYSE